MGRSALIPKGQAMALHLSTEYVEGREAFFRGDTNSCNPYCYWNEYMAHYALEIGWQSAKTKKEVAT